MSHEELEMLVQKFMLDFNKDATEISGKMWVKRNGLTLDIDEYLQLRLNEVK